MDTADFLSDRGVRPTANRILVVRELFNAPRPLSLSDLEISLAPMDKGSIFRVLELLTRNHIVHVIEDGSRSIKYEICKSRDHHTDNDQHVHFYCENCKKTYCMEGYAIPLIEIPEGFKVSSVNYVVKGLCPECNS